MLQAATFTYLKPNELATVRLSIYHDKVFKGNSSPEVVGNNRNSKIAWSSGIPHLCQPDGIISLVLLPLPPQATASPFSPSVTTTAPIVPAKHHCSCWPKRANPPPLSGRCRHGTTFDYLIHRATKEASVRGDEKVLELDSVRIRTLDIMAGSKGPK